LTSQTYDVYATQCQTANSAQNKHIHRLIWLSAFWHKYKELCESLKGEEELSVFPAVPVSAAFEMGRRYMVGVYPKMVIYDRDGEFFETLTIGD
jgi:hypothetical protein